MTKKKIMISMVLALVICGSASVFAECGDVNSDGAINIVDSLLIAQAYVGGEPSGYDPSFADVNDDGTGNIVDALLIAQFYVGILSDLPGCSSAPTPTPGDPTLDPLDPSRTQAPYPDMETGDCGSWVLKENVCTARYCSDALNSEDCTRCGGNDSALCVAVDPKGAMSGAWPPVTSVSDDEPWHYSRSTNFGITTAGACQFGLYNVCSDSIKPGDQYYLKECEAFCRDYPDLCAEPEGITFRGNWAAPQGNYYTQFWATLEGERDNYLSCGECFEVERVKKDGSDYEPGEAEYTDPIILVINDSCPCSANSKWCCGAGRNHCYEVSDFKYGCPMPPDPPLPANRDPSPEESIHLDLGGIAMTRLQSGDAHGNIIDGVVPIKYRRVPCPVVGNIHIWMMNGASEYWFGMSVVNVTGLGSVVKVEAQLATGEWMNLGRDGNYTSSRPQERPGTWVTPQNTGPYSLPVSLRFTSATGEVIEAVDAIESWTSASGNPEELYYIDTGVQFE